MKIDHYALRVPNRHTAAKFYLEQLHYSISDQFDIHLEDGSTAQCLVLTHTDLPDIFISDSENGLIKQWVESRGRGGLHHIAYQVDNIDLTVQEWKNGGIEFLTDGPLECEGLRQIFTKEQSGLITELIERKTTNFCKESVKSLMEATKNV